MPGLFFVLLSNWPVFPIALADVIGVVVGVLLFLRRRDWVPLLVIAGFGIRAISTLTRVAFYVGNIYASGANITSGYDPVTGAAFQQTMNCVVAAGGVATLALIQTALWFGLRHKASAPQDE
ncbi:MAG: hypothetical protein ACT4QE_06705 [Anaerolineales bacterium]